MSCLATCVLFVRARFYFTTLHIQQSHARRAFARDRFAHTIHTVQSNEWEGRVLMVTKHMEKLERKLEQVQTTIEGRMTRVEDKMDRVIDFIEKLHTVQEATAPAPARLSEAPAPPLSDADSAWIVSSSRARRE